MPDDLDLAALTAVANNLPAAFDGIEDRPLSWPTPCSDWSLAELVDHVTGGNWFTLRIIDGESADRALALTLDSFSNGHASFADAISTTDQLARSFLADGVLDRSMQHLAGPLSGRQVLRLRLQDLIVHSWDIAQTIDPPASLPAELVEWGRNELDSPESLTAVHFGIKTAPRRNTVDEEDALALYLAAFGR